MAYKASGNTTGPSLSKIATQAGAESARRGRGETSQIGAGLATRERDTKDSLKGDQQARMREYYFRRIEAAKDAAAARQQKAMEEATAAQSRAYAKSKAEGEQFDWQAEERFKTDESIRQMEAQAQINARYAQEEDPDAPPPLHEYGRNEVSPLRGASLAAEGQRFALDPEAFATLQSYYQGADKPKTLGGETRYFLNDGNKEVTEYDVGWRPSDTYRKVTTPTRYIPQSGDADPRAYEEMAAMAARLFPGRYRQQSQALFDILGPMAGGQ